MAMARTALIIGVIGTLLLLGLSGPALSDGNQPATPTSPSPAAPKGSTSSSLFSDVPADHWAIGDLQFLVERGIITGLPNGKFQGDQAMTRYAAAAMVARALRFALNNPDLIKAEDLKVIQELIYKVNDRIQKLEAGGGTGSAEQLASLQAKVQQQAQQIQSLQAQLASAKTGSPDVTKLRDQANASFIIGLAGLFVGIIGIALAVM
ncbi:MAG: S-layer homology domain-containing protein [Candidatus Bipolaricaulia bacterium]